MLDPWIDLLTAPFIGIMAGFSLGFFERDWGTGTVGVMIVFGVTSGVVGWLSPVRPDGVGEGRWDSLSRADRRQVVRAVARGHAVPQRRAAQAAVDVAKTVAARALTRRDVIQRAGLVLLLGGVLVASMLRGAPPEWVAASAVSIVYLAVLGALLQSRPVRERARRAAEANRALLAPEGVAPGITGVPT